MLFIAFANNFKHISSNASNLILIALKLDFLSSIISLRV